MPPRYKGFLWGKSNVIVCSGALFDSKRGLDLFWYQLQHGFHLPYPGDGLGQHHLAPWLAVAPLWSLLIAQRRTCTARATPNLGPRATSSSVLCQIEQERTLLAKRGRKFRREVAAFLSRSPARPTPHVRELESYAPSLASPTLSPRSSSSF